MTGNGRSAWNRYSGCVFLRAAQVGTKQTSAHCCPVGTVPLCSTRFSGRQSSSFTSRTTARNAWVTSALTASSVTLNRSCMPSAQYSNTS